MTGIQLNDASQDRFVRRFTSLEFAQGRELALRHQIKSVECRRAQLESEIKGLKAEIGRSIRFAGELRTAQHLALVDVRRLGGEPR